MKNEAEENRMSEKDALKEALKRHIKVKLGKVLSPAEGEFFLSAIATFACA